MRTINWGILGAANFALQQMGPAIHGAKGARLAALATSSEAKADPFRAINPDLRVLCRAENQETAANMASFGTRHIINPFERFSETLALSLFRAVSSQSEALPLTPRASNAV